MEGSCKRAAANRADVFGVRSMQPQNPGNWGTHPQQPAAPYEQINLQILPVKNRFRSTAGLTASGVLMAAAGGLGVFLFGLMEIFGFAASMVFDAAGMAVAIGFAVCIVLSGVLLGFGVRNLTAASRLKSFRRVFGSQEALTFDYLASYLHATPAKVRSWARKLLKRGYIPQGRIDDQDALLMVTDAAYHQHCQLQQQNRQMLESQQALREAQAAQEAQLRAKEEELASRLTDGQHEFVLQTRDYLKQLRTLDERIDHPHASAHIVAIEDVVRRILARAEEEPSVIAGLSMLTTYYLPTTVKLLDTYDGLEDQPVQGSTIAASRQEIESTLEVLRNAFEKLLDSTYQDLSLDVSTDISVLHAMLAREGLTESPFDMKP